MAKDDSPDYTREAAYHLRQVAADLGRELKSSAAHELIAGYFGFGSRAAMTAKEIKEMPAPFPEQGQPLTIPIAVPKAGTPSLDDPFLFQTDPDMPVLESAIVKVGSDARLTQADASWIAHAIKNGLAPECIETEEKSFRNLPVYDGDDQLVGFASPGTVASGQYGTCRFCGDERLYPTEQLSSKGLCREHRHELDLDDDDQDDLDSYVEYGQNH